MSIFTDEEREQAFGADIKNRSIINQAKQKTEQQGGSFGKNLQDISAIDTTIDVKMKNPKYAMDSLKKADELGLKGTIEANPHFRPYLNNKYISLQTLSNIPGYMPILRAAGLSNAEMRRRNTKRSGEIGAAIMAGGGVPTPEHLEELSKLETSNYYYRQDEDAGFFERGYEGFYENAFRMAGQAGKGVLAYGAVRGAGALLSVPASAVFTPAAGVAVNMASDKLGKVAASAVAIQDMYEEGTNQAVASIAAITDSEGNRLDGDSLIWTARAIGIVEAGLEYASDLVIVPGLGKIMIPGALKNTLGELGADGMKAALRQSLKDPVKKSMLILASKKIGTAMTAESVTEFLQELSSILITDNALLKSNQEKSTSFEPTPTDEALAQAWEAGKTGAAVGLYFGAAGASYSGYRAYKSEQLQQLGKVKASEEFLVNIAQASKNINIENPAEHAAVIQDIADKNGKGTVFVAAQSFKETYGENAGEIAERLGVGQDALEKAAEKQEEISFPTGKAAEVFIGDGEGLLKLNKIKRFENEALTPAEVDAQIAASQIEENTPAEQKKLYGKNWVEAERGHKSMKEKLLSLGISEEYAEAGAQIFKRRLLSASGQFGVSPSKWLKQNKINIQAHTGAFGSATLGGLSASFEGSVGSVSTGTGDAGGVSYGKYQLNTKDGVINDFMSWLKKQPNGKKYAAELGNNIGSAEFNEAWKRLATEDPQGFGAMQDLYVKPVYYDTAANNLKNKYGLDISTRSHTLKEVLFSNSVQHGSYNGALVFQEAAQMAGKKLSEMTDAEIIKNIYEVKLTDTSWSSGSPSLRPGLFDRWQKERQIALDMLEKGTPQTEAKPLQPGETVSQYGQPITNLDLDLNEEVEIIDFNKLGNMFEQKDESGNIIGKAKPSDIVAFVKNMASQELTFPTKDINILIGLPDDKYARKHIVRNAKTGMRGIEGKTNIDATEKTLSNMTDVLANAVLVEVSPNFDPEKSSDAHARSHKRKIESFYNFFLPIKTGEEYYALKITAENYKGNLTVDPKTVSLYQIDARGENKIEASSLPSTGTPLDAGISGQNRPNGNRQQLEAAKISIRDMLKSVKGEDGKPYINEDGTGNFGSYDQGDRGQIEIRELIKDGEMKREAYIDILKGGDISTVIHEFAHLFLQDFSWLSNNADSVTEQAAKDWSSLKNALDIKNEQIVKDEQGFIRVDFTKEQHEKFASQFEQYILEGNAPSLGLMNAFRRFKSWLTDIYRDIIEKKGYIEELDPEIRGVFDRMLATEEEIEVQKNLLESIALLDPATDFSLWEEAYEQAKEKLLREKIAEIKKERSEEFRKTREDTKSRIESELSAKPLYRALNDLAEGAIENLPDKNQAKLNINQIKRLYGDEAVKRLPKKILSKDGILHPDDVANMYGFKSGQEFLEEIRQTSSLKRMAHYLTNEEMRKAIQPTQEEKQQIAQEAMNNEITLDIIQKELEALAVTKNKQLEAKQMRQQAQSAAEAAIAAQTVRKAKNFRNYFNRAIKTALDSKKAFVQKDEIKALQHKMRQMEEQALGIESVKFKDEYKKTMAYFEKFLKRTEKQKSSIAREELGVIQNLLQTFGLEKGKGTPDLDVNTRLPEWIDSLPPAVKDNIAGDGSPLMSAVELSGQKLNDLTVEEFRAVADAVRMIEHEWRRKDKLYNQDIKLSVGESAEKAAQAAYENIGISYSSKNYKPLPQRLKALADKFNSWIIGTENIIWEVDGRKFDGFVRQLIWQPVAGAAFEKKTDLTLKAQVRISDIWSAYSTSELWHMRQDHIPITELGDRFTKMEMLVIALNCGAEDNYKKLKEGRGWSDENVNIILNRLDKRDWKTVQSIWDMLEEYYPELNELEKRTKGIALKKVPPRAVSTKHGVFKGGYYPLKADTENLNTPTRQKEEAKYNRPRTPQGHTKSRTKAVYAVSLDESYLYEHLEKVIQDISYREAGIDISRVLYHKNVESALKSTIGKDKYDELTTAIQKTISIRSDPMIAGETIVRNLRTSAVGSLMSGKLSVASQQIAGIFSSMGMLGITPVFHGALSVAFNRDALNFIRENSAFMRERPKTRDRDIRDSFNRITGELGGSSKYLGRVPKKSLDSISEWGFKLISFMDMMVSCPTWYGAYLDGLRQFDGDEKRAVSYADTAVRQSQGSGHTFDQAAFQRDGNEYSKIFSAFTTPGVALYRLMWRNVQQMEKGDIAYQRGIFNIILAASAQGALAELLAGRSPDDDEEWEKWAAKQTALFMASAIPIFRDVLSYSLGESRAVLSSPVAAPLESAGKLFKYAAQILDGENVDGDKVFKEAIRFAGFRVGYPQQLNIFSYNFLNWVQTDDELEIADLLRFRR